MRGIMIAAPSSGSGKTMLTCGLLALLRKNGVEVEAFKCGPDYIDPLFHRNVLGIESCNLDSYFQKPEEIRQLAGRCTEEGRLCLVEGVMGYFDGLGGVSAAGSSCEMAGILEIPVILVVDGRGASLSLCALIQGFLNYSPQGYTEGNTRIAGVILNKTTAGMYGLLKQRIEEELPVRCLGYVPPLPWLKVESRHLGLVLPGEIRDLQQQMDRLAEEFEKSLDLKGILALAAAGGAKAGEKCCSVRKSEGESCCSAGRSAAENCLPMGVSRRFSEESRGPETHPSAQTCPPAFRLGVALDEAFCFYYRENLRALEEQGAVIEYFSPLHDRQIPDGLDGLLLGGGYPELYAGALSANAGMRASVYRAAQSGMPMLGECGGYLYLLEELEGEDGMFYPMAGVFSGTGKREGRLRHFGYISLSSAGSNPWMQEQEEIRGHEFHYWHCQADDDEAVMTAKKPVGGRSWPAMRTCGRVLAGFPHLYYRSLPEFALRFAALCREYRNR